MGWHRGNSFGYLPQLIASPYDSRSAWIHLVTDKQIREPYYRQPPYPFANLGSIEPIVSYLPYQGTMMPPSHVFGWFFSHISTLGSTLIETTAACSCIIHEEPSDLLGGDVEVYNLSDGSIASEWYIPGDIPAKPQDRHQNLVECTQHDL